MKRIGSIAWGLWATVQVVVGAELRVDSGAPAPLYAETGTGWVTGEKPGQNGLRERITQERGATAIWKPDFPFSSAYQVYAVFRTGSDRVPDAKYTLSHVGGSDTVEISQQGSGDIREVRLGVFSFAAGTSGSVRLTSPGGGTCVAGSLVFRVGTPGNDPPQITSVIRMPPAPTSKAGVVVTARITDETSVTSAVLRYQILPGGSAREIPALDDGAHSDGLPGDHVYGATIPAQPDGKRVVFAFQATDAAGLKGVGAERTYHVSRNPEREFRALWADSWQAGLRSRAEVDELVATCREANINMLIPEVRKVGDAYYKSALEPRATNIVGGPDFDPLGYILRLAHDTSGGKKRLQVHAWFVMNRIAKGETLHPDHILSKHPEYEMLKSDGTRGESRYLDPGHPGAVDHNLAVILDCLGKYDLDGYHFDYIRYPELEGEWGYNPTSIARFNTVYGRSGTPKEWDPDWKAWRRECVSLQVKKIYVQAWKLKPSALLTASTINWGWGYDDFTSSPAWNRAYQDWSGWLRNGIIDYNALMNYTRVTDAARFQGWTARSLADEGGRRGSIIGVGAYLSPTIQGTLDQLLHARSAGAAGLNLYDWGDEVKASTGGETREQFYAELKKQVFPTWVEPPVPAWRSRPQTGMVEGTVISAGRPVDHAVVRLRGKPETETVTDGSGWYGILHVPPGSHTVEVVKSGLTTHSSKTSVSAGKITTLNVQIAEAAAPRP